MQQQYFQILKKNNGRVIVELDEQLLETIINNYQLIPQIKNSSLSTQIFESKFQRRIVPFFLNQFMHWSKQMNYKQVECYLKVIHNRKTSKQQKWELGDLQKIFGPINSRTKCIQTETQQRWKEFLYSQAEIAVVNNTKIKDQLVKRKYIDAINQLKKELYKKLPYRKFLSIPNYQNNEQNINTDIYINENNLTQFEDLIEYSNQQQDRPFISYMKDNQESI
ncbi:unnamed protein product [Paramecium pentaurelia]|uniref:Uncharacterized protein n=1 Tax=Paramecium pentaurelia TaxID=43138 RepID=A0A8S1WH37_9CILI|nr:unnamed protein product [Paramecium pentaurelia]